MAFSLFTIVGARPQFVKAAAISRALRDTPVIAERIVHTGQHYDANMSDVFFDELEIPHPARHLGIGGGGHGQMTGRMLEGLETAMIEDKPDAVLIYGDTNSTLAGALAAAKLNIPVIHIEAGLRSFNRRMPEEINRVMADHVSTLLVCPTAAAVTNLANEGITKGVVMAGDVMADATLFAIEKAKSGNNAVANLGLSAGSFVLCTLHRAENTDDPARFEAILAYVVKAAAGRKVVLPVHPRIRERLAARTAEFPTIVMIDPVGYFDMHALLAACGEVLTDSGGLQKEAYFHRKPCVTLRDETEWVETIAAGWNRLWTTDHYVTPQTEIADYGNGDAAKRTIDAILDAFGLNGQT
jgi:UDP-GlcNAc3NAcA epimerase